jgi:DNA polymerase-3 subunit alpha
LCLWRNSCAYFANDLPGAEAALKEYLDIFGKDNFFLEMQNHDLPEEQVVNRELRKFAKQYDLKLVITNDLHYVHQKDAAAQDVLLCIQTNKKVDDPDRMRFNSDQYYCKSYEEMLAKFPGDEEALANTHDIAERCHVEFTFGQRLLPEFPIPKGYENADVYLEDLCQKALPVRYAKDIAAKEAGPKRDAYLEKLQKRLAYELGVIKTMGFSSYFLIVSDFINYCRSVKLPVGPGRGSAAGSIVAFLLHITNIDPLKYDLLFERFLNPERVSMPDIDTDFCYRRRDEVLQYVIHKYGTDRVALIITFGTLQARAAVRDAGRALGISLPIVDKVAKAVPREIGITLDKALRTNNELKLMYEQDAQIHKLIDIAKSIEGLPRNSGTHAAGVVIAPKPLIDYVPLQLTVDKTTDGPAMITTQYDKDKVEHLGLLKMDFLGLRTLTVIDDALKFIKEDTGKDVDIDDIPLEDPITCGMLSRGDTQGVFQLESDGMTKLLVDLAPTSFRDLIPLVALYRPGPLGSGMAEDFISGRHGKKTAKTLHPLLEKTLADTYGVVLYQEQVMQITSILAGFSLGQADNMRRAMGHKDVALLNSMKEKFVEGALEQHQIPRETSESIFEILHHFAGYGFNKSHSVAYALVAYQTAYLKAHWPAEFFAAFLSSVAGDLDKLSWYITVCRERNIKVLPPDVNASMYDFSVENGAIRFGMNGVKSVGSDAIAAILNAREKGGKFASILDFCKRVSTKYLNRRVLENLIRCGAFDSLGAHRSQLLAVFEEATELGQRYQKDHASGQIGLFEDESFDDVNDIKLPDLDEMPRALQLKDEKELLGFYVTGHPLDDYRELLKKYTPLYNMTQEQPLVREGNFVHVAGLVTQCEVRITKRGDSMAIATLEDFTSKMTVVIFPKTYQDCSSFLVQDAVVAVEGRFAIDEGAGKVERKLMASKVEPLTAETAAQAPAPTLERERNQNGASMTSETFNREAVGNTTQGQDQDGYQAIPAGAVISLRVAPELETAATQQRLLEIFTKYHGTNMIFLELMGSRKRIRVMPQYYIKAGDKELQKEIAELLGPKALKWMNV